MRILCFLFLVQISFYSTAQSVIDYWHFGDSSGIHFTPSGPEPILDAALYTSEPSASISDEAGNLLFYTNGYSIWNRNNELMQNGETLNFDLGGYSVTQGSLILPDPETTDAYYVFHLNPNYLGEGLFYSKVDMTLDGGLGGVISSEKDVNICDSMWLSEKMMSVRHGNGKDWWLLLYKHIKPISATFPIADDNQLLFYLIDEGGITYSHSQTVGQGGAFTGIGEMVFSQAGDKLAFANGNHVEVYAFDRCAGEVKDLMFRDTTNRSAYGAEFSPDGSKLYITEIGLSERVLLQYSCTEGSYSKELIYRISDTDYLTTQLQLGPDEKIYMSVGFALLPPPVFETLNMNLCVINNPNESGLACDFDTSTIFLGGKRSIAGLPNLPNYKLGSIDCEGDTLTGFIDKLSQFHFSTWPNPFGSRITITTDQLGGKLIIYDLYGNILYDDILLIEKTQISLREGAPGSYFYTYLLEGNVVKSGVLYKLGSN